jgi:hypothetical protein
MAQNRPKWLQKGDFWLILTNFRNFAKNDLFEAILGDFGPF